MNTLLSMIEIAKARTCQLRDTSRYEECLLKSITYCNSYVTNYTMLGEFYLKENKYEKGVLFIKHGLSNIYKIVTPENAVSNSPIDMDHFFNQFFKGIVINCLEYSRLSAIASGQKIDSFTL